MNRNDLLDQLAADAEPVRRADGMLFTALVGSGFALSVAFVILVLGLRGVPGAANLPIAAWKVIASGLVASMGAVMLLRVGQPGRVPRKASERTGFLAVLLFAIPLVIAIALNPAQETAIAMMGSWAKECTTGVALSAIPLWFAALAWLKLSAPTDIERASWTAGLATGAAAATAFTLHCPYDAVSYVGLWYLASILGIAAVTRVILPPLIRW